MPRTQNISLHLKNIFEDGELGEDSVVKESLTTAEATIDKLRDAIKGVGQFDVTGYCHMCDEYKMHNEKCPHTVSALAAKGGE